MNQREYDEIVYIAKNKGYDLSEVVRALIHEKYQLHYGIVRVVAAIVGSDRKKRYATIAEMVRLLQHATQRIHTAAEIHRLCGSECDLVRSRRGDGYRLRDGLTADEVLARGHEHAL